MKYMMFVATDAEPDASAEKPGEIERWLEETADRRITGERLRPARDAKTVRVRGGKVIITDGPFTETKEVIVGFDILECDSIEGAIAIAAKHPMARAGRLELRPFWPFEE
ncbi:YciI family protein [Hyphomicrobium sp. ghe19]|uniref:YciI family protein n=1 Tax=Hyphomicrobium sp. ghe19 TaxID=2682968 RepID=UPI001366B210|nr:hypothetical protein HYPP_04124 [Hyphomicrobium sp. ghe19]